MKISVVHQQQTAQVDVDMNVFQGQSHASATSASGEWIEGYINHYMWTLSPPSLQKIAKSRFSAFTEEERIF